MLERLLAQDLVPDLGELPTEGITGWEWGRAAIIFAVGIIVAQVLNRVIGRLLQRAGADRITSRVVGRLVGYVIVLAAFVYALASLQVRVGPLLGALGIGGLALALALQDTLQNFIAGILLETRRPFRRGDQIFTNDYDGTVEDINLRSVILRTFDGKRVVIPNSMVTNSPVENYTVLGSRRTDLVVGVAYGTDLRQAKDVIVRSVRGASGVFDFPVPEAFATEFSESSIDFTVHFWHAPGRAAQWAVRDAVAIAIKEGLDEAGITIPFPQRTLWFGAGED